MNKVIKQQLEKVRVPLPDYDDSTTLITILREGSQSAAQLPRYQENHCYLIELANYILNEPPNFTLSSNWNKGVKPVTKYLKVVVNKVMGSMIQVDGSGFDSTSQQDTMDSYIGLWLPIVSTAIIQEL